MSRTDKCQCGTFLFFGHNLNKCYLLVQKIISDNKGSQLVLKYSWFSCVNPYKKCEAKIWERQCGTFMFFGHNLNNCYILMQKNISNNKGTQIVPKYSWFCCLNPYKKIRSKNMKTSVRDKKSVFMLFRGDNIMLGKYNFVCSFVRVTDN